MPLSNRVRELRELRGLTQLALAQRSRLTRQSLGAIEAGRAVPAVDVALRLAEGLGCRVEELFSLPAKASTLDVELSPGSTAGRMALAFVRDRWIGLPLAGDGCRTAADAIVLKTRGGRATVAPLRPVAEARNNLVLAGCATGLGLLTDRLQGMPGTGRYLWCPSSTHRALQALANGGAHVAGIHAVAMEGAGDANVALVQRTLEGLAVGLVTLARWEVGLLTRRDDRRVHKVADLAAPELRLVVREKGAAVRQLLERRLRAAGLSLQALGDKPFIASGHLDVARVIAMGAADVGVATRDAAIAFGLRFVPLADERYDLVIPEALAYDVRVTRLLDELVSQRCRRELQALGYDVASTGQRVAGVDPS